MRERLAEIHAHFAAGLALLDDYADDERRLAFVATLPGSVWEAGTGARLGELHHMLDVEVAPRLDALAQRREAEPVQASA